MKQYDVCIIGGGASGLMAAISAAESGASVLVLDKNPEMGKKILITGNGHCNYTNLAMSRDCYHGGFAESAYHIIQKYDPEWLIDIFRSYGIEPSEKNGYLYPLSGEASSVRKCLVDRAAHLGARLLGSKCVKSVTKNADGIFQIDMGGFSYESKKVIIACGGYAAPETGSEGDGYRIAEELGHSIVKPLPALVPLKIRKDPLTHASGVRLPAGISLICEDKCVAQDKGELQLTDYGISGIMVFQVSGLARRLREEGKEVSAVIHFFPDIDDDKIYSMVLNHLNTAAEISRDIRDMQGCDIFSGMLPVKLSEAFMIKLGFLKNTPAEELLQAYPDINVAAEAFTDLILHYRINIETSRTFTYAQTTSGGISSEEVDHETLESLKCRGLYFCGEVLDVDGICGGYNLQWAFASGYLAGQNC